MTSHSSASGQVTRDAAERTKVPQAATLECSTFHCEVKGVAVISLPQERPPPSAPPSARPRESQRWRYFSRTSFSSSSSSSR
ncbi:hypothetical protein E2C01_058735 [Portunus trituberculatus]|uniref:Uncharacterized protein n=1 Tax=Portunus trituberculatus TaxID=210409 RepID=A0A5B7H5J8_PORTR|nr:hypothetical protein [Portunus trituberculatus]